MLTYLLAGAILFAVVTVWVFLERWLGPRESMQVGCIGIPGRGCPLCVGGVCVEKEREEQDRPPSKKCEQTTDCPEGRTSPGPGQVQRRPGADPLS